MLGMSMSVFTDFHVAISLLALVAGVGFLFGLVTGRILPYWGPVFLITTIATSVTGFMFPFSALNPPHIVGIISLVVLAVAVVAYYRFHATGAWRWIYVVSSVAAFYLNAFVGVVQAFQKTTFLNALAPTGSEPPFVVAQTILLMAFIGLGFLAVKRFRPAATAAA